MPGITLYTGNRLEDLAGRLADIVSSSPLPVFGRETVVLQSHGMMKWLTVEMCRRLGIWANYDFLFPNRMAGNLLDSFFPGYSGRRFFDRDIMTWRCIGQVLKLSDDPVFRDLSVYTENDSTGLKLFQLCSKITDLFDQYITFRPEMILDWDNGGMKGEWQAELWRMLTGDLPGDHPPALLHRLFDGISSGAIKEPGGLPGRIAVFGISYLPVYHLNILRAVSNYRDVNLFILNPSNEYWGDILSEKEKRRIISREPVIPGVPEDYLHLDEGNTLLASLGRVGRDFLFNIFMSELDSEQLVTEPERKSLLSMIQNDIYRMENGAPGGGIHLFTADEIRNDGSFVINSCHSAMREVEVLHDYIIDLFNSDGSIRPPDILVMTPDIEKYSSAIQGVFGRATGGVPVIPFTIVDRKIRNSNPAVETFFKILNINESRFTSAYIAGIAECGQVMERFGLERGEVDTIGRWIRETCIFWGTDSAYKSQLGLPGIAENTWSFGLNRMMTGGIMDAGDETAIGILPYGEIEGGDLQVLGRFISFYNAVAGVSSLLKYNHTLAGWGDIINRILDSLFHTGENSPLSPVYDAAASLRSMQDDSGFTGKVSVSVIAAFLEKLLSESTSGLGFVSGGMTFCEMLPMRSIPCRVICLLGMSDSAFPRKSRTLSFDLTAASPKRGDRSVRDEDRYLFLETVISARERLYISYTGRSMESNSPLNPSVVVSELLEYADRYYGVEGGKSISGEIVKTHRIQPYNPVYFTPGSGFYTYHGDRIDGARSFALAEKRGYSFFENKLPVPDGDEKNLTINGLASFLYNPSKWLLNRRLGINLSMRDEEYTEQEPFRLGSLETYSLGMEIMQRILNGTEQQQAYDLARSAGILPHGVPGRVAFDGIYRQVKNFCDGFSGLLSAERGRIYADIDLGGYTVAGPVDNIYGGKAVFFRYASAKGSDYLTAWVTHLALCASGSFNGETVLAARDGVTGWGFIGNSREILRELAGIYEKGMTGPLPVFPSASFKYAEAFYSGGNGEPAVRAFRAAEDAYENFRGGGDITDPYISKVFGAGDPLSAGFERLALQVYSPVFENLRREGVI